MAKESVSINEALNVKYEVAESLEKKGLWRRAAAAVRRNNCQRMVNRVKREERSQER
ncbi:TPA: hypothetical protein QCJ61_003707 [Enterobacter asburiae]|uniref:hypothetical protein n=1 Tax=Enterobacter sp. C4G1 TaxID=3458724 RepID=UPI0032FBE770|nr:hypothetical protein [Enterobacter asburiae]HDR2805678.1 hypothetical protein [Enterobacter asburiae]HDR2811248.1 hypothetical protein [Enterobacter asburiae]HDR2816685.1 hypothetical protein [Enterobacter asburiae]